MSVISAAEIVLREAGEPLHYREPESGKPPSASSGGLVGVLARQEADQDAAFRWHERDKQAGRC
jgi:hypothetical protein